MVEGKPSWRVSRRVEFLSQQEKRKLSTDTVGIAFHISLCGLFVWLWSFQFDNLKKTQHASKDAWFYKKMNRSFALELFQKLFSWRGCKILVIRFVCMYCFQIKADYCRAPYMYHTIVGLYDVATERSPWLKKCPFFDIFCKLSTPKTSFRSISPFLLLRI